MAIQDQEKIKFYHPIGHILLESDAFGLINTEATYKMSTQILLYDMMHK